MAARNFSWILLGYLLVSSLMSMAQIPLPASWQGRDAVFNVPFTTDAQGELHLENTFYLDSLPDDSLYLYFEGIGWNTSLVLNDVFLGVHQDPFEPWLIPLAAIWCKPGSNRLQLRLSIGEGKAYYPKQFVGIFRPAYISDRAGIAKLSERILPTGSDAAMAAAIAPYYGEKGYEYGAFEAAFVLAQVKRAGLKHVFFPYRPDRKMLEMCAQIGLVEVKQLSKNTKLAWINSYPYEPYTLLYPLPFWLNEELKRTPRFGSFIEIEKPSPFPVNRNISPLLILIIVFPWLSFLMLKLLNPALFELAKNWRQKPNIWVTAFLELLSTNSGMLVVLQLLRVLTASCLLSMLFFFINQMNRWELLNWFKDWSLLSQIYYGHPRLESIFLRSLLIVLFLIGLDQLMGWIGNTLFRIPQFTSGVIRIGLIGSYPGLWVLTLPWAFALLVEGAYAPFFVYLGICMMLIHFFRRIYLSYIALGNFFAFSPPIKILYICALNILPYIIWF